MEISKIVIDQPRDRCITQAVGAINGWFAIHYYEIPEAIEFRVGPIVMPHMLCRRPDVEGSMSEHTVTGFQVRFDLMNYLPYIQESGLLIQVSMHGFHSLPLRFTVKDAALAACIATAGGV
jgi:hypothetical protein